MKSLAQIISIIFHPIFIPLFLAVIFVNSLPFAVFYSKMYKIFILGTIAIFTCIVPVLFMLFKYFLCLSSNVKIGLECKKIVILQKRNNK
jgi:uncharacterized membrane protein